jgi:hypothetical protein
MFVMSVWVACLVRAMSFAGLGALGIANVEVHYDVGGEGWGGTMGRREREILERLLWSGWGELLQASRW